MVTKTFPREVVYHSALKRLGGVLVTFTGPVQTKGDLTYIPFRVQGEEHKYRLHIDNPRMAEALRDVCAGVVYELRAKGVYETATVAVTPAESDDPSDGPVDAPPPVDRGSQGTPGASLGRRMMECLLVARDLRDAYQKLTGEPLSPEVAAVAVQLHSARDNRDLPLSERFP